MNALVMNASPEPARVPAAVLAVLVHVLLFSFLFFGVRWSASAPEAVVVELWTTPPVPEAVPEQVKPSPPPEPPPPPRVQPRPEPKVEAKAPPPVRKPDIAVEKDKKAPPKPASPKPDNLKFDLTAQMRQQAERELAKAAPREPVKAAAPPPAAPSIDNGYAARINAAIKSRIPVFTNIPGNPEAIFEVIQLPTHEVLQITMRKSSGYKAYDEAVERAIRAASPLPGPDRPDQFQRQLNLTFRPKDLQ